MHKQERRFAEKMLELFNTISAKHCCVGFSFKADTGHQGIPRDIHFPASFGEQAHLAIYDPRR
jgi:hypothetical protein